MLQNRKKLLVSFFLLISILVISFIGLYVYFHRLLETKISLTEENLRHKGYALTYSNKAFSGNPFNLYVTLQNPTFKDPSGLIEWKGQEVRVSLKFWDSYTLHCVFGGSQSLSFLKNTPFSVGVLHFEGTKANLTLTSKGVLEEFDFKVDQLVSEVEGKKRPVFFRSLSLKALNLTHPLALQLSLSTTFQGTHSILKNSPADKGLQFQLDAHLSGYANQSFPKSLAEWRDGGGVLDIDVLKIDWPPILAEANGTITLDQDMYPLGSFSSRLIGYQEVLGYLVELGWVKSKNASAASFVLDLFSKSDEAGNKQLTVPITLQNKRLSIGPASLLKLQPVEGL